MLLYKLFVHKKFVRTFYRKSEALYYVSKRKILDYILEVEEELR
jgi:hypothetical protein